MNKVYKVVYNVCYGGFSLSRDAILLARKLSKDSNWGGPCILGDTYDNGALVDRDYGYIHSVARHDPILVAVVESLGKKANGTCAKLDIQEVCGWYKIEEYDGRENVLERANDDGWVNPAE